MALPDEAQFRRSKFTKDSIQVPVTNSPLSTKVHLPPGMYQLVCDKAIRWLQGGSWVDFAVAATAPSVTPSAAGGGQTQSYKVVAIMPSGYLGSVKTGFGKTAASSAGTTTDGPATLDGTTFNSLSWTAVPGAQSYEVYRTAGGPSQGLIATVTDTSLDDKGLSGDSATPPAASTVVGTRLTANTYWGNVWVDDESSAYFDAYTTTASAEGTLEFIPAVE